MKRSNKVDRQNPAEGVLLLLAKLNAQIRIGAMADERLKKEMQATLSAAEASLLRWRLVLDIESGYFTLD